MLRFMRKSWWLWSLIAGMSLAQPAVSESSVGSTSVGLEAGLPLVLGIDVSHRVNPQFRVGMGVGRLSGLTAIRAEGRWLLRDEESQRLVPSLLVGAEQYFLSKGDEDATPVGVHAALGVDYHFATPVSLGIRIGVLKTFSSSEGGDLKVFSVQNGYTSGIFNAGLRYHF